MSEIVIAGNTSGSVTIAAPDVAGTTTLTLPASSGTVLDDASVGVCRAWVNFNGTGTVAIRAAFNVSSITDNGVGNYTVNFTTAMPDTNYASPTSVSRNIGGIAESNRTGNPFDRLTSSVSVQVCLCTSATATDIEEINVAVFR